MTITEALAPAFVAAMGMQHLVELFAPKLTSDPGKKKWIIGIAAFIVSGALCWYAEPLRVIARVMQADPPKTTATKQDQKNDVKKEETATTATNGTGTATGTSATADTTAMATTGTTATATTGTTATASTGTAGTTPPSSPPPPFPAWVDVIVSAGIISAGTDGFNSILKFLGYKKEEAKDKSKSGTDLAKAA